MLADGVAEFGAAELGEAADGFLDVGDLAAGEALAEEGGRFQVLDTRVDGGARSHPKLSWQIRAKKSSPCAEKVCRDVNILGIQQLTSLARGFHPRNRLPNAIERDRGRDLLAQIDPHRA